jgi:hypothetical protein
LLAVAEVATMMEVGAVLADIELQPDSLLLLEPFIL